MELETLENYLSLSDDHLDVMFFLKKELIEENIFITDEKNNNWVCEWDNTNGDLILFR